jgi:PAS domain-containing protein
VGYWIRSGKLRANRVGRDYVVPEQDLLFFLNASGKSVPAWLQGGLQGKAAFPSFRFCWEYRSEEGESAHACNGCMVQKKQMRACFAGCRHVVPGREIHCHRCRYYVEHIQPRIGFIHQLAAPAAVYEGLHIWGANARFRQLTGFSEAEIPGLGIERVFHADSLERVISNIRRRALGSTDVPTNYEVYIKKGRKEKGKVKICVVPLEDPEGIFLILFNPVHAVVDGA